MIIGGAAPPGCPSIAESAVTGINSKFKETLYIISKFSLLDNAPKNLAVCVIQKRCQSFFILYLGISQMVFIWTIMSVFAAVSNVVANINNNQNNNNNNDNNINLNIVSTQNTQISSNVNNANTISIMLPPPIPVLAGGRKLEAERRLKRHVYVHNF